MTNELSTFELAVITYLLKDEEPDIKEIPISYLRSILLPEVDMPKVVRSAFDDLSLAAEQNSEGYQRWSEMILALYSNQEFRGHMEFLNLIGNNSQEVSGVSEKMIWMKETLANVSFVVGLYGFIAYEANMPNPLAAKYGKSYAVSYGTMYETCLIPILLTIQTATLVNQSGVDSSGSAFKLI